MTVFDHVRQEAQLGQSVMVTLKDIERVKEPYRGKTIHGYFVEVRSPGPYEKRLLIDGNDPEFPELKGKRLIFFDWLVEEANLVTESA